MTGWLIGLIIAIVATLSSVFAFNLNEWQAFTVALVYSTVFTGIGILMDELR